MIKKRPIQEFTAQLERTPARVRKRFLSIVASLTGAANAFLILPELSQRVVSWKKQPSLSEPQVLIHSFENRTGSSVWIGNHWLLRLKWQKRPVGILILMFRRKKSGLRLDASLKTLCQTYTCWEMTQHLRNTIETQQTTLQNLSAESAAVARDYVRLRQQMRSSQNTLQSITKGILRTQEEERAKISREMHDGIGQELTALKMNLDILSPLINPNLSAENQERWNEAKTIAEQALQDIRELSRLLRPRMLDDLGLFPTLRWYVRSFVKRVNISVDLQIDGDEDKLNPEKQTILFRVVQEALNNVAKHSHATSAVVRLQCGEQEAYLRIRDDGVGFDPNNRSAESGSGLAGMRDRVMLYKGRFDVHSEPQRGTQLEISIPL
jgi:signal transduction histidine kinase